MGKSLNMNYVNCALLVVVLVLVVMCCTNKENFIKRGRRGNLIKKKMNTILTKLTYIEDRMNMIVSRLTIAEKPLIAKGWISKPSLYTF